MIGTLVFFKFFGSVKSTEKLLLFALTLCENVACQLDVNNIANKKPLIAFIIFNLNFLEEAPAILLYPLLRLAVAVVYLHQTENRPP